MSTSSVTRCAIASGEGAALELDTSSLELLALAFVSFVPSFVSSDLLSDLVVLLVDDLTVHLSAASARAL